MGTEILLAGEMTAEALQGFIAAEAFLFQGWFLGESIPRRILAAPEERQELLRFDTFTSSIPVIHYTSGRIFHADFELRWEQDEAMWRVVYLGIQRVLPVLENVDGPTFESRRERCYYLFGKRLREGQIEGIPGDGNFFAEARIPRLLHYPAPAGEDKKERVQLRVYEYMDKTGQVKAFRFAGLQRAE